MKIRIIIGNLLVAFVILPIIYIHKYMGNIFAGYYQYHKMVYDSLGTYLGRIFEGFIFFALVIILLNLLPFQFLKNKWLYKVKRYYFFVGIGAYFLFNCLSVLISGYGILFLMDTNPWSEQIPFVGVVFIFSLVIQLPLYFVVDRPCLTQR